MSETTTFKWPFPTNSDAPAGPAQIEALAKAIEERLKVIEFLVGTPAAAAKPEPGQLVLVSGISHPIYKAITGDVTFNSSGVATLGPEKVIAEKIKGLAVETAKIANAAVTAVKLGPEAVETAKIKLLAVTTAILANEAVTTGKIMPGAITAALIASEAVGTAALAAKAVTEAKLADKAVGTAKLEDSAVTEAKIASAAVGAAKLATGAKNLFPQSVGVSGSKVARGSFSIFVNAEGNSTEEQITHGLGATPFVQLTPVVAKEYGGRFDTHVTFANSTKFGAQVYSGALPEAVTITLNWLAVT